MTLALILSDKLDIKYNRITDEGKRIIGNRQYQYIEDILLDINSKNININFICDNNIDLKELMDYFFTKKVFKTIKSFSKKFNLNLKVSINGRSIL